MDHQFTSISSPLSHYPTRPTSDTSSLRTTSPPLSPISTTTAFHRQTQYNLFNLSFHPTAPSKEDAGTMSQQTRCVNHPPSTVLRGRSSQTVLRRRPSAIDMALSEERSRCDGDSIERKGLDLMEPRPVDVNANANATLTALSGSRLRQRHSSVHLRSENTIDGGADTGRVQQPKFVLGGIFEVMEGQT
ncbi:hypothetical protein N7495_002706 [Penicillium taxi]|uniref:uncharacterized protein n=1 Tax=Penicillium taxi TaxID=168475 RepID=UPI002544DFFF|nr:uncharacterized protein N7495_002706 [Penicillium taxi]KAJ5902178.1 hypothetical protein N7495_002706 [Penicillium taxi]